MIFLLCLVLVRTISLYAEDFASTISDASFYNATDASKTRNNRIHETQMSTPSGNATEVNQSERPTNVYNECEVDQNYDYEVRKCRRNCSDDELFYPTLDVCVLKKYYKITIARPLCKNITVPHQGFDANANSDVLDKLRNWILKNGTNVINGTNGVTVCYPFSLSFMLCRRWGLYADEYELTDHSFMLWSSVHNRAYSTEDFSVNNDSIAFVCRINGTSNIPTQQTIIVYTVACCVSSVSLFLTICIFAIKNEWKYHTNVLLCHNLSLFVFYTVAVLRYCYTTLETDFCAAVGIIIHLTFLAAFFWLSVLAYEIWSNLCNLHARPANPQTHAIKFIWSSIYAWGLPLLISGSAVAINYQTSQSTLFNPMFARDCWLSKLQYAHILFMYAPAACIMTANLVFYVLTVLKLRSLGRDGTIVNADIHKQLFKTYLRLMVVMGVCWIMEIISGIVDSTHWGWYLPDMINCLQGFFIFIVYFCKRSVLRDLQQTWKKCFGNTCCQTNRQKRFSESSSAEIVHSDEVSIYSVSSCCESGITNEACVTTNLSSSSSSSAATTGADIVDEK